MGDSFSGIRSIFACHRGKSFKRLHRPNRFRVWLHELEVEEWVSIHDGLDPVYLNAGLRKPRRGFTLAAGKKNWRWASCKASLKVLGIYTKIN